MATLKSELVIKLARLTIPLGTDADGQRPQPTWAVLPDSDKMVRVRFSVAWLQELLARTQNQPTASSSQRKHTPKLPDLYPCLPLVRVELPISARPEADRSSSLSDVSGGERSAFEDRLIEAMQQAQDRLDRPAREYLADRGGDHGRTALQLSIRHDLDQDDPQSARDQSGRNEFFGLTTTNASTETPADQRVKAGERSPALSPKPVKQRRRHTVTSKSRTDVRKTNGDGRNKKASVIALMQRHKGATLAEIVALTGWQRHTVRGFISTLGKKELKIESFKSSKGERTYKLSR